jgi:hypothetical protein
VQGLATFTNISVSPVGGGYTLTASARTFTATSTSFSVTDPCGVTTISFPGVTTGALQTGGCTTPAGFPAVIYRFTASPSNSNKFAVSSSFTTPAIEVMTDPPTTTGNVVWTGTGATDVDMEWLLPAGTYRVRVSTRTGPGSFTLTGSTTPFNTAACVDRSLVVATQITQTLAATDCARTDDGTYYDVFALYSTRPCTITMTAPAMRSFLLVYDGLTDELVTGDDGDAVGGTASVSLPSGCQNNSRPILIHANTYDIQTGTYTLNVAFTGSGRGAANYAGLPRILEPELRYSGAKPTVLERMRR